MSQILMDQIPIKTPNPKFRLYWCLIEFIDWRDSQSCWYFRPLLWTSAPLTFSLVHPFPFPVWISTGVCVHTVCKGGGEGKGSGCVESIYRIYTLCIWPDSEPTKFLYHPKPKPRRGGGLRQIRTPAAKYFYWSIFKKSLHLGFGVFIDICSMLKL
jgi:hypothetical protein